MTYNIPGVFTSVIDRSYIQPMLIEGRSILVAGFSKYGGDQFYNFADADTMEFTLGEMDIRRYGKGLMYSLGALTKTRNVIFKRLMPEDATYANLEFKTDGTTETIPNLIDPDYLKNAIDEDPGMTIPPVVPAELEILSYNGQTSLQFEYNPANVVVWLNGSELSSGDYVAENGIEIIFTPAIGDPTIPLGEPGPGDGQIINVYTTITNLENQDDMVWINEEIIIQNANTTVVNVPGGYDPEYLWISREGQELANIDYIATDGVSVEFQLGGVSGNGLNVDETIRFHSVHDNFQGDEQNTFHIHEFTVQEVTQSLVDQHGYNPDFTSVTVNGVIKGGTDYSAIDGRHIEFNDTLEVGEIVRLHTITPGNFNHIYGSLIAKAPGAGYNDLYVKFRPAYDIEKIHSDDEGDSRYKFNFLKATVFEQTSNGQKRVSDEFPVSLIDVDPISQMPIISTLTGEALYINDKFAESNEFIEYYQNESFLPQFYKDLNIEDVTTDGVGNPGGNRFILNNHVTDTVSGGTFIKNRSEIVVVPDASGESVYAFEKKSTLLPGKDTIFTYYHDPLTGNRVRVAIEMYDGKLLISERGSTSAIDPIIMDGITSFFEAYLIKVPAPVSDTDNTFHRNTQYTIIPRPQTTNHRWKLYNLLIGGLHGNAVWQMKSGSDGKFMIVDGRLNLGEVRGNNQQQDAKQLIIDFYNHNDTIHEVLYPELDFDYIPDWTGDIDVMNAIVNMADEVGFTMPIISLPRETKASKDYTMRIEDVYYSSFNTAMYSGQYNDNHYMEKMGSRLSVSPSYYAMLNHLQVDETISITEPMANIVKGQLPSSGVNLSYIAKSADIERLRGVQVNTIIKEIDGIYFIDQLTAYKSASKLSRINVVKVIHRMRKDLPKLLKDLLQRKALENILLSAKTRTEQYMSRWIVTDNNTIDGIFTEVNVTPLFIEEELKLIVSIAVRPIGTIEKIEVPITVF